MCEIDGAWQLHGLTSFGYGCAEAGYPGVYTRVSEIISWVQGYTNNQFHLLPSLTFNATAGASIEVATGSPVVVQAKVGKMVEWNIAGAEKVNPSEFVCKFVIYNL